MSAQIESRPGRGGYPWRRFFARMLDYGILFASVTLVFPRVNPDAFITSLVLWAIYIPIEAGLLWLSNGKTFGKWLFRLRVVTSESEKISFRLALKRSAQVWWKGEAGGIPIIGLLFMMKAYERLQESGTTSWDKDLNTDCIIVESFSWRSD